MRTQKEIVDKFRELSAPYKFDDAFGWQKEVLIRYMSLESLRDEKMLRDNVTEQEIKEFEFREPNDENVISDVKEYMAFALDKAYNHRGISASRSVAKMGVWIWLLNRPDLEKTFNDAHYENYGVPQLKVVCDALKVVDFSTLRTELQNMAAGQPCIPDCQDGCRSW